jgi:hypothetical protein
LAPQNTVNDDINVPVNRNGIIRNIYFNAKTSDPALLFFVKYQPYICIVSPNDIST